MGWAPHFEDGGRPLAGIKRSVGLTALAQLKYLHLLRFPTWRPASLNASRYRNGAAGTLDGDVLYECSSPPTVGKPKGNTEITSIPSVVHEVELREEH